MYSSALLNGFTAQNVQNYQKTLSEPVHETVRLTQLFVQQEQGIDVPDVVSLGRPDAVVASAQRGIPLRHRLELALEKDFELPRQEQAVRGHEHLHAGLTDTEHDLCDIANQARIEVRLRFVPEPASLVQPGSQSFPVSPEGADGPAAAFILLKAGHRVKDTFLVRETEAAEAMLSRLAERSGARSVDLAFDALGPALSAAPAEGPAEGTVAPPGPATA